MSTRHRYRIEAHLPAARWWWAGFRFAVLFAVCMGLYVAGIFGGRSLDLDARRTNLELRSQLIALSAEHAALVERVASARRQDRLNDLLTENMRTEMDALLAERAALRRELEFYLRFVDRAGDLEGIQVQDLVVAPAMDGGGYRFRLVLVQDPSGAGLANGVAQLSVTSGEDAVAPLAITRVGYEFRYFQLIEGSFDLPYAAQPALIKVDILPAETTDVAVSVSFPWHATS